MTVSHLNKHNTELSVACPHSTGQRIFGNLRRTPFINLAKFAYEGKVLCFKYQRKTWPTFLILKNMKGAFLRSHHVACVSVNPTLSTSEWLNQYLWIFILWHLILSNQHTS
jgi:hypothetical protein